MTTGDEPTTWVEVQALIDTFLKEWPEAEWGPAHVAISDNNLSDGNIREAIRWINALLYNDSTLLEEERGWVMGAYRDQPIGTLHATKGFLVRLLEIAEDIRDNEPESN